MLFACKVERANMIDHVVITRSRGSYRCEIAQAVCAHVRASPRIRHSNIAGDKRTLVQIPACRSRAKLHRRIPRRRRRRKEESPALTRGHYLDETMRGGFLLRIRQQPVFLTSLYVASH